MLRKISIVRGKRSTARECGSGSGFFSMTAEDTPRWASSNASDMPTGPPPMIKMSVLELCAMTISQ